MSESISVVSMQIALCLWMNTTVHSFTTNASEKKSGGTICVYGQCWICHETKISRAYAVCCLCLSSRSHTHEHSLHMDLLLFSVAVIISCIVCKFIFPLFKSHVLRIVQTIISASCLNDFVSHPTIYLVFYAIFSNFIFSS